MKPNEEPKEPQSNRSRIDRAALPSLGFGLLFASYIGMIGHAGTTPGEFFFSSSLGILCAGLLALALGAWAHQRSSGSLKRFALLASLVLGFGSALVGGVLRSLLTLDFGSLDTAAGFLFGAGCLFVALAWTEIYASYHFIDALRRGTAALFCGVIANSVAQLSPSPAIEYAWCTVYLCGALACALFEFMRCRTPLAADHGSTDHLSLRTRLVGLARHSWAPLCGLGICSFLLGSLWMQTAPLAAAHSFESIAGATSLGPVIALALIGSAAFRISRYDQASKLFWIVMPITAAIFLITPSLEEMPLPYWNLLVANLQNAGSACMLLCTWALLLLSARTNGLSVYAVFGGSLAFVAGLSLWGAFSFDAFGLQGNVISVVLFILYMSAVILFLAWGGGENRASRHQASEFFNEFIQTRCEKIAEVFGLTPRESELLVLLGRGHGYAYIAETLYISETTVRTHARNIYRKLGISSQEELLALIDHTDRPENITS
ncbi:MAG: helix-turn-helix transcriptional regulator [Adlercreutzia sp.]|nr:helix-turn-helix transcriptional regulator [Adlercreutzia sp.]